MLTRALAILAALGGALAVFFGLRSKQHQAEAAQMQQRAAVTEAVNDTTIRIDAARQAAQQRHRDEQQAIEKSVKQGDRDHLDTRW